MVAAFCNTVDLSVSRHFTQPKLDSAVNEGVQLANQLSATYDDDSSQGVMPRRGLASLYSALLELQSMSIRYTSRPDPEGLTKALNFARQAIQAQDCTIAINSAGNVSFANLFGVDNDRTKELLFKCAFVAANHARYKTAKQFLNCFKEMHFLEHCDTTDFPQELAWLETMQL